MWIRFCVVSLWPMRMVYFWPSFAGASGVVSPPLLPQAARLRTISMARIRAIIFFVCFIFGFFLLK